MKFHKGIIDYRNDLTKDVYEIDIIPENDFSFEAGQFITIKIPTEEGKFEPRAYSICSSPKQKETLTLCIKRIPGGLGSNFLYNAPVKSTLDFIGPVGNFVFKSQGMKNVFFICTGTGIVPFMSILDTHLAHNKHTQFHLLFGLREKKDLYYQDILNVYTKNYDNFSYDICLSQEKETHEFFSGRVTKKLETLVQENDSHYYICGNRNMVDEVLEMLKKYNIPKEKIFSEKY